MNRQERANIAAEAGFPHPMSVYADFGTIASVAGPIIGGLMQGDSAQSAANSQQQASDAAIAEQRRQYDISRQDLAPYRKVGGQALYKLSDLLGLPSQQPASSRATPSGAMDVTDWARKAGYDLPSGREWDDTELSNLDAGGYSGYIRDYLSAHPESAASAGGPETQPGFLTRRFGMADRDADPVYQSGLQFGLNEGTKGLNRAAAARGSLNSGATLKALERFGNDYGSTKAADSYNRFVNDQTNIYNRLAGVAGTGQTASNTSAQLGANTATNVGNILTAQGNARGAATIAGGNAMGGAFNTIGNYYGQQNTLDKILAGRNGSSNYPPVYGSGGGMGDASGYSY